MDPRGVPGGNRVTGRRAPGTIEGRRGRRGDGPMRVLVLGSGALKIGEAGEFDYSGSQALKAPKGAGIGVWLLNPNIAPIQASPAPARRTFPFPGTPGLATPEIALGQPDRSY